MKSLFRGARFRRSPLTIAALAVAATTVAGAGAATVHRFAVTQTTGSEGATTFLNSSGGALQGEIASSPNTGISLPFGMLGEYDSGTAFGVGVIGLSTTGYAVGAEATGASPAMLALNLGTSDGIDAAEKSTAPAGGNTYSGVYGEADGNGQSGVYGYDTGSSTTKAVGVGVLAETAGGSGFYGVSDPSTGGAMQGAVADGRGLVGAGYSGTSVPAIEALSGAHGTDAFHANIAYSPTMAANEFYIQGTSQNRSGTVATANAAADVQMNGDLYITGGIYSGCGATFPATSGSTCTKISSGLAITKSSGGDDVQTYGSRHASPTLEDEGEARMVSGMSHVALDPTFARTMSTASPYMVFVTPEGDSALYVTNKTVSGFDVRAIGGSHATLAFSYRIVARPFGTGSSRMAIVPHRAVVMNNNTPLDDFTTRRVRALKGRSHNIRELKTIHNR